MGIDGIENLFGDDFPQHKNHDETDVPMVIKTHTGDGPGFSGNLEDLEEELPASDIDEDDEENV